MPKKSTLEPPAEKRELRELPNGEKSLEQPAKEDAGFVRDSTGEPQETYGLEVGAGQVQAARDKETASGVLFGDGSPPDNSLTVAGVTGNTKLQDLADKGGTAPEDAAGRVEESKDSK